MFEKKNEIHASSFPMVSVVMPIRNEVQHVESSLECVLKQDYPANLMQVIVADGMSTDGTQERIRALQLNNSNLKLIENPGMIVSTGMNYAWKHCEGDIIIRVDGHCEVAPSYVKRCVAHLRDNHVDGVGGPIESVGRTPLARTIAHAMSSWFGVGGSAFRSVKNKTMLVDTIPFPAYTRAIVEKAGPYDEELVRNQDDEYNYHLRELGAKLMLAGDVKSRYYSRSTLSSLWRQYFQYGYWKVRVMQKHPRQMQWRHFVPVLLVLALLLSLLLMPLYRVAMWAFFICLALYLIANVSASLLLASRHTWQTAIAAPLVFGILHFSYGTGFLWGLIKFCNRWWQPSIIDKSARSRHSFWARSVANDKTTKAP